MPLVAMLKPWRLSAPAIVNRHDLVFTGTPTEPEIDAAHTALLAGVSPADLSQLRKGTTMATMDIFEADAFSVIELRALENIPFKPALLSSSNPSARAACAPARGDRKPRWHVVADPVF